jgi:hypothetical protein
LSIKSGINAPLLPKEALYGLPALKHLEKPVCVPHINYSDKLSGITFSADFVCKDALGS